MVCDEFCPQSNLLAFYTSCSLFCHVNSINSVCNVWPLNVICFIKKCSRLSLNKLLTFIPKVCIFSVSLQIWWNIDGFSCLYLIFYHFYPYWGDELRASCPFHSYGKPEGAIRPLAKRGGAQSCSWRSTLLQIPAGTHTKHTCL